MSETVIEMCRGAKTWRVSIPDRYEVFDWLAALQSTLGRYAGPWRGVRMDMPIPGLSLSLSLLLGETGDFRAEKS
jgi:hypothetical protein